ncbi:UPF0236 family transposase-like protein, partial [Gordonibacter sp.]|uniref:UPF0236 family transposase-like protein n=1 Tax=Gordonibacter sp. TaxID=1968902 RepID=UPI002FCB9351
MYSTMFSSLVTAAANYFYAALCTTEDFDSFCRDVQGGMRSAARAAVAQCIGRFDDEVKGQVPTSWELRGNPTRKIVTMFGEVEYARRLYRDNLGCNRYPTDELLGIPKRQRLSADAFLWLVRRAACVSYRRAATDFAQLSGTRISPMCAWRAVQLEASLIRQDTFSAAPGTISQVDVFAEADGIFVALQTPQRRKSAIARFFYEQSRKKSSFEIKCGCVYAGKTQKGVRSQRGNVALYATCGTAEDLWAGMNATIAAAYVTEDIEVVHYASDAGGWCKALGIEYGKTLVQGLDLFHVMKYVHRAFPDGAGREHLVSLALRHRPEALACACRRMACQVKDERRRQKIYECGRYVTNNADLLRGGGSLGTMEATNAYVWAKRMKSFACSWSRKGAEAMALVL